MMKRPMLRAGLLTAMLALAACNGGNDVINAVANGAGEGGNEAVTDNEAVANIAAPSGDLFSKYVGKYPFDKVGDHSWNDDPAVLVAIEQAITDDKVRQWVKEADGPSTPIGMVGAKVASWACEAHNCGPHNWTVMIDPKTGLADVCYYDADVAADKSRWFVQGREEERPGRCPDV